MPLYFGSDKAGSLYLGSTKIGAAYMGNVKVYDSTPALNLPYGTIRCQFSHGYDPSAVNTIFTTWTLVDANENIWDAQHLYSNWSASYPLSRGFGDAAPYLLKVLGCNTQINSSGGRYGHVETMQYLFYQCTNLTSVALFDTSWTANLNHMFRSCSSLVTVPYYDTSYATEMPGMFWDCTSLTSVPAFNLSNMADMSSAFNGCTSLQSIPAFVTTDGQLSDVSYAFNNCRNVEQGALSLYQTWSSYTNVPATHQNCFTNCGSNTVTGAAELAQIDTSWGGTQV